MHTGLMNVCPLSLSVVRVTGTARPHSGRQDCENVLLLATVLSDDLVMHDALTLAPLMSCGLLAQHATHSGRQDRENVLLLATILPDDLVMHARLTLAPLVSCDGQARHRQWAAKFCACFSSHST